jgi:hypothetical protein
MLPIKEQYIIDTSGNTTNVILTKKDYERLVTYIEELEDIAAYDRAKTQSKTETPWRKVRR